jgi:hypothetical protein
MHLSVFISFLFCHFCFVLQLLQDHRLSIKAKLDLQARLEEARLGSLLFWHGEEAQPQYTARHCNLSTRPQTVRSGAATCRWSGPDRPGQSTHEQSVARPLTARERERTTFDDGRQRRPATARPTAQSNLRRPSGAHDVGWDAAANVSNNGSESSSQTPVLRLWAMFTAEEPKHATTRLAHPRPPQHVSLLPGENGPQKEPQAHELQKPMLKCGVSFKCQPDRRWKELYKETAQELQVAAALEQEYTERMSSYSGKKMSRARVQLNTPRDDPNRARVLNCKTLCTQLKR